MILSQRATLTQYLIDQRRRFPEASGDFNALILDVALACKAIAQAVGFANRERMRRSFLRVYGEVPRRIRQAAGPLAVM